MKKTYLGDGVYAHMDTSGQLVLAVSNGIAETETIFLEPEVLANLGMWLRANFPEHAVLLAGK